MKVSIQGEAAEKLKQHEKLLTERGATKIDLNELVSNALLKASDTFWRDELEAATPPEYWIKAAMSDERLMRRLLSLAKRGLSVTPSSASGVDPIEST
jgi:hypothetical protein